MDVFAAAVDNGVPEEAGFDELRRNPLAAWVETELGLQREQGKWVRTRQPKSLREAAGLLADTTARPVETCERALAAFLLRAHDTRDMYGRGLFAFRLHQFVTGGDLFGTLEPEDSRYFTLNGQQYQPGTGREKGLFTYCFCRECGQEYLPVWASEDGGGIVRLDPRDLGHRTADDADLVHGLFMPDSKGPVCHEHGRGGFPREQCQRLVGHNQRKRAATQKPRPTGTNK